MISKTMMAEDPQPIPAPALPPDSSGSGGPPREEDIKNTARIGQERFEKEAALQQRLKGQRRQEEAQSRTAMIGMQEKQAQEKARKKGYRTRMSIRDRELADENIRRERQEKFAAGEKRALEAKRKKGRESLQELHDTAAMKFAMEQRKMAKREEEAQRQKTETEYRHKLSQAEQAERTTLDRTTRDVRSRKGIIDGETREKLFKLETLKRLKMHELESLTNRELAAAKSDDLFAFERKRATLAILARTRQRRTETDLEEKRQAILAEDQTQKIAVDADAKTQRSEASADRNRATQDADRWYNGRLNEIERRGKE